MKIKTVKGKATLIRPSKTEEEMYQTFVKEIIDPVRNTGADEAFHQPRVRGFRAVLIPHKNQDPCEVCTSAQFNKLCTFARKCIPMLYSTLWQVTNIEAKTLTRKGTKSCIAQNAKPTENTKKTRSVTSAAK